MPLATLPTSTHDDASSVHSVRTILVAAGGGGDAITSAALSRALNLTDPLVIMTYSWDRLMIDPLPGPRSAADFTGLRYLGPHTAEIVPNTQARPPAGSSLPRLAAHLPARLLLLDPSAGAIGMADQLSATAELFEADTLTLVDVGGDILTHGKDPGLRSPLADQLALAACLRTGIPTRLVVAAPSIDGELNPATLSTRLDAAHADQLPALTTADLAPTQSVFIWHPSHQGFLPPPPTAAVVGWKYETPATRSSSPTTHPACTPSTSPKSATPRPAPHSPTPTP
jgi:hypothetical protein